MKLLINLPLIQFYAILQNLRSSSILHIIHFLLSTILYGLSLLFSFRNGLLQKTCVNVERVCRWKLSGNENY